MIAYIDGKLAYKDPTYVIIEAGGLGYQVKISLSTYSFVKDEEKIKLLTYLHIKEDAHTLYGFAESGEKKLFLDLISISGVGPGTALMVLSSLNVEEIKSAILQDDVKTLQSIKGIGGKTAQRIILELKDKLKKENLVPELGTMLKTSHNTIRNEALSALVTLGIPRPTAEKNIDSILKKAGKEVSLEELIKIALKTS